MDSPLERGYDATPMNPVLAGETIHDLTVVPPLADATPLNMVDVFRSSGHIGPLVEAIIRIGAKCISTQVGVIEEAVADKARVAGITVAMDRGPIIEERRLNLRLGVLPPRPHLAGR